ncbi:hypothetical protein BKA70DRAFT_1235749, partial [Coprinopsis sp. MPI-PUGE-AT-0042]
RVDLKAEDMESIDSIRQAIFHPKSEDDRVCFACEATVVAIAPYRKDYYSAVPIIASPSCKRETGEELRAWIKTVIRRWKEHEFGEQVHGPLWAIGSDGDAAYRYAKYLECLKEGVEVDGSTGWGKALRELDGLNLRMSEDGVVATCDPKHIIKRFATLLRNPLGFMIGDTIIRAGDILHQLKQLDGMTDEMAEELLNPADKQNVPKAVSLMHHLGRLDTTPIPDSPSTQHKRNLIIFFSKFLNFFVEPFGNVDMDLSAQIISLSTFAHIAAALYDKHQTACLTGALYADAQAVVKNVLFTLARTQEVDPDGELYILLEGTDRLEGVFGDTRAQDHNSNYDLKQLAEKLAIGAIINATYERNKDLDRGHRRLSLSGAIGVDHVNPSSWMGNVKVAGLDLKLLWEAGQTCCSEVMNRYLPSLPVPNFKLRWANPMQDLLRPNGTYVGSRKTEDDARSDEEPVVQKPSETQVEGLVGIPLDEGAVIELDTDMGGSTLGLDMEEVFSEDDADHPSQSSDPKKVPKPSFPKTIEVNGKQFYKSAIVASMLSSKWSKKFGDRMLRVRGIAKGQFGKHTVDELEDGNLTTDDLVKVGDLAAVMTKNLDSGSSLKGVAMAVVEMTGFMVKGNRLPNMGISKDDFASSTTKVVCQVLDLDYEPSSKTWEWSGHYLRAGQGAKLETRKEFVLEIPGAHLIPLAPKTVMRRGGATPGATLTTWRLTESELEVTMKASWQSLDPQTDEIISNVDSLPTLGTHSRFPYRDMHGALKLTITELPGLLRDIPPARRANTKLPCLMVEHVGRHILDALRRSEKTAEPSIKEAACGFCGRSQCFTQLKKTTKKTLEIMSICPYRRSKMPPSTRYDSFDPTSEHPGENLPPEFLVKIFVSRREEEAMGISEEETSEFRDFAGVPDSDGIEAMMTDLEKEKDGRGRSKTITGHSQRIS